MIWPKISQTTGVVAAHYDELDNYYSDAWGDHVHHGYRVTRQESVRDAVEARIDLLASRLDLAPGQQVCVIGCGYGATARYLAARHNVNVTGLTASWAQAIQAQTHTKTADSVSVCHMDWLANGLASHSLDCNYAIESSEHMRDKQRFFDEAFGTLGPGRLLAVCAWFARDNPRSWEFRHLLEPIGRQGRLPSPGKDADYRLLAGKAGFDLLGVEDLSDRVSRTWWICAMRFLRRLITQPRYIRFLTDRSEPNCVFAMTLFRLLTAYRTRSMRYCLLTFSKPPYEPGLRAG
jgi:tocopherol O-methyltransferase